MGDWQPIETAPRDGSAILCSVRERDGESLVLRWCDKEIKWVTNVHAFIPFTPTHWQLLPPPPKEQTDA